MRNFSISSVLIGLILLSSSAGKAQFFGLRHGNPSDFYGLTLKYPVDGKYRVVSHKLKPTSIANDIEIKSSQILIYDQNLSIKDSIQLNARVFPADKLPLKLKNRLLWPAIAADSLNNNLYEAVIEELDTLYKHVSTHKITTANKEVGDITELVHIGKHFYFGVYFAENSDSSFIFKLNEQFVKVDSVFLKRSMLLQLFEWKGDLLLNGSGFAFPCVDNSGLVMEKLLMDTTFSVKNCFTYNLAPKVDTVEGFPEILFINKYYSKLFPFSSTKVMATGWCDVGFSGSSSSFNLKTAIVNVLLDGNNNIIRTAAFSSTTTNYSTNNSTNIVDIKKNEIITVGVIGMSFQKLWLQSQKSRILVIKTDTLGNLIWKKEYGGDMYYHPRSIIFTNDGGYLISGMRYDSAHTDLPNIMDAFLLKIGPSGEYQSIKTFGEGRTVKPIVKAIPNPACNKVCFDIPFESQIYLRIYDLLGKLVYEENNYETLSQVTISDFPDAVYSYELQTEKSVFKGKFCKVSP